MSSSGKSTLTFVEREKKRKGGVEKAQELHPDLFS
jgi:hypothetical protein